MNYARACLRRADCNLPPGASRTVFLLLADSHNNRTGMAFTGTWLAHAAGVDMRTVRRVLHRLRDDGYLRLEEQEGLASIVTFPIAAYLSTAPDADVRGEHSRAPDMGVLQPLTPVSPISEIPPGELEAVAREALCCDGTGWIYDESTRSVSPCPFHHRRGRAVGS